MYHTETYGSAVVLRVTYHIELHIVANIRTVNTGMHFIIASVLPAIHTPTVSATLLDSSIIVLTPLGFYVLENKYFRCYQRILKPKAKMRNRKSALGELREIKTPLRARMKAMLEG